jgi:putative SOS response-associated peptidase YedK
LCEQFSLTAELTEIMDSFQINKTIEPYKQCPSITAKGQNYAVITLHRERCLKLFRWGLMPFWAKDSLTTDRDYVFEKRAFHRISTKNRCVMIYGEPRAGKKYTPVLSSRQNPITWF